MQPSLSFAFSAQGMEVRFHDAHGAVTHSQHVNASDCLRAGFDAHRLELMMKAGTECYFYKNESLDEGLQVISLIFTDLEGEEKS